MRQSLTALHQQYVSSLRKRNTFILLTQAFIVVLFIGLWEWGSRANWIDSLIFSSPSKISVYLYETLASGSLLPHIGITVLETVVGFLLGTFLGTLIAAILWWFPFVAKVMEPFLVVLNSMPKVALGPLFIVGIGAGFQSIVAITLLITVIITTINIYNRFCETGSGHLKVAQVFGASKYQLFYYVIFPSSLPVIVSTLKVNVGLSWIGVIVGEFLVAKIGLGYLIIYGFQVFNFTIVLATLVVIAIVATIMYQVVNMLEKKFMSGWQDQ